ncbi:MAG: nucleotidyltransferase family protein [Ruminococcus sp.]|nr:nucleotidyltransferase family protein [Ruminococcus sp.]
MAIKLPKSKKQFYIAYIDLLASVLNEKEPPKLPEGFDWDYFCRYAQRNSVANILAYSIDKVNIKPSDTVAAVLENERRYQIIKETSQIVDIEKVVAECEKAEIKNALLKGYFMKQLYPRSDFRTMTDIDFLTEKKSFKKIEKIFTDLGFEQRDLIKSSEIHFKKGLLYCEVQSDLNENLDSYYNDIWDRVELRDGYSYSYRMKPEDFYIYMVYHAAKHFSKGGIGIRMVMDAYVCLKAFDNLDFIYIDEELKKVKLTEFESRFRALSLNWFSSEKTEIDDFGEFVLYCSTFGAREVYFYQDSERTEKFYWLKQVFIPLDKMKGGYAYLNKMPFLLPFSWGQYWIKRVFISRDLNLKAGFADRKKNLEGEDAEFVTSLMNELKIN